MIVLPASETDRVCPLDVAEAPSATVVAESLKKTLCVEFEVMLVALVLTGSPELPTSPDAEDETETLVAVRLVVPVDDI